MNLSLPTILVNFKTYESASGKAALELAKIHEEVALAKRGFSLGVCVSALDLAAVAASASFPVFAQHVDPCGFGASTGFLPPAAVKAAGAFGTLLNHAEHKISDEVLAKTIAMCREVGLFTVVCAESLDRARAILGFAAISQPDLIALEPPELIGGDISVSTAQPELISAAVEVVGAGRLLVGAGVKNGMDVATALRLGASGVLLASGVTKAADPKKVLEDLTSGS